MVEMEENALELTVVEQLPSAASTAMLLSTSDAGTIPMDRSHSTSELRNPPFQRNPSQQTHAYGLHKVISESAMDISLLTANANQLRLLMTYNCLSRTYIACVTLVIISLTLQVLVATGIIIIKSQSKSKRSPRIERLKIATSICVTIITVINILVASLVVTDGTTQATTTRAPPKSYPTEMSTTPSPNTPESAVLP